MTRVAVTGASGFVGRAVLHALAAAGQPAVAVSRGPLPGAEVRRITGLDDAAGLRAAFAGAEVVVHLAARVHVMRETAPDALAAFRAVNVEGTRAMLEAAAAAGVARIVHVSTVKVHGEGGAVAYTEESPLAPSDAYARSKAEGEALVEAWGGAGGWSVVRPPLVYGPGVGANFERLVRLARLSLRWPVPLGGIRNRRSLVFVENLADAIARLALAPAARGAFLVSDAQDLSTSQLLEALARGLGGHARLLPCPEGLLRAAGRLLGREGEVERLLGSLTVDPGRLRRTLGWDPPVPALDALARTAAASVPPG